MALGSALAKLMQQLTYMEPGRLAWQEVPDATLEGDLEAIVRPVAVANCDLDGLMFKGLVPMQAPFPVGHEFIADVVDVGPAVSKVRPGDRVIVPFQVSCGACARCLRGLTSSCQSVKRGSAYGLGSLGGGTEWGGALSDVVRVPYADSMLVSLPAEIDAVVWASSSDNLPDAYRTVGPPLAAWPGAPVLVVSSGFGSIPLYAAAMAVALGAERVDFIDPKPERLELVAKLGANPVEGPPPRRTSGRYPVTVDASASAEGLGCALRSTEAGGTCTSIGIYFADTPVPLLEMYTIGVTLTTGRVDARRHLPAVLGLYERGFRPELVLSATASWADAAEAFVDPPTKLVITRD